MPAVLISQGSGISTANDTALVCSGFTADIPVGSLLCMAVCTNVATALVSTVTDTGGTNVYSLETSVAGTAFSLDCIWVKTTAVILSTDTVTFGLAAAASRKSVLGLAFRPNYHGYRIVAPGIKAVSVAPAAGTTQTAWTGTSTGTLTGENFIGVNYAGWKGATTAPTYSDSTSGFTAVQGTNSGGTVTTVQAFMSYNLDINITTAYTDSPAVTVAPAAWGERHVVYAMQRNLIMTPAGRSKILVPSWAGSR